ncbi:hypothetical protein DE171_003429 [Clostridium beijerinckii]|nr:hypothetical protein [Clostridium beijerinckii]NYC50922.1 hypothetical protein [Clostridium beijerinckii]
MCNSIKSNNYLYIRGCKVLQKKYMILSEELDKIKVNNVCDKENI